MATIRTTSLALATTTTAMMTTPMTCPCAVARRLRPPLPLPQPFRRLGEAAGAEGGQNQSLDRRCIGGGFDLDAPGDFPGRVSGGGVGHEGAQLGLAVP